MKIKMGLVLILFVSYSQFCFSQSGEWTYYNSTYYKGYHKTYQKGDHKPSHSWKWSSWKTSCCTQFYYYTKNGKIEDKILCGDVRDFYSELKKWKDLKYGYRQGWKNIQKVVHQCKDNHHGNEKYASGGNRKYQFQHKNDYSKDKSNNKTYGKGRSDNKDGYNNKAWYKYYGKGNVIFTKEYNYEGSYKAKPNGSFDYRRLGFYPQSIIVSRSGRYVVVNYRDQYRREKSFVVKNDIPDLKSYMTKNLKLGSEYKYEPYKAITKVTVMQN